MPVTPPSEWFSKVGPSIREQYPKYDKERRDQIAAGIWHGFSDKKKRELTRELEKNSPDMSITVKKAVILYALSKDFGGWVSPNSDWEEGFNQGEKFAEDRMKRGKQIYTTPKGGEVEEEQKKERRESLDHRFGETEGKPVAPGGPTSAKSLKQFSQQTQALFNKEKAEHPGFSDEQVWQIVRDHIKHKVDQEKQACKQYIRCKSFGLFMPLYAKIATKSVGEVQRGDLIVEGYVSTPVKDLQGDVLELPALVKAKESMVKPPHNLFWLDHNSPYAKPQDNQETPPAGKFVKAMIIRHKGTPALWVRGLINKAHPKYNRLAYELKNGFYNAFSMEFVPVREGVKFIKGKLANAISDIKYFATSLVRAPAVEGATITRVYSKAFANSSRFYPVRVTGPGWIGQTVKPRK